MIGNEELVAAARERANRILGNNASNTAKGLAKQTLALCDIVDGDLRMLLDGLEVASIKQLKERLDTWEQAQPLIAALAVYGEAVNVAALVDKARTLAHYEGNGVLPGVPVH